MIDEKLTAIADNMAALYTAGQKDVQQRFWDAFQKNGTRTDYKNAFGGEGWTEEFFKPRYSMQPKDAYMMLRYNPCQIDLAAMLEEQGITLDFSRCTDFTQAFFYSSFTRLPVIDFTGTRNGYNIECFSYCHELKTIDLLIIREDNTINNSAFVYNESLENIRFQGVIGDSLNLGWSEKLTRESIENIFAHLSTTATGKTLTLSRAAVDQAFMDEEGLAGSALDAWVLLAESRPNWTIDLIE